MNEPLETEIDYASALAQAEVLMDSKPNTPQGSRLMHLVALIRAYEDRVWPIDEPAGA